MQCLVKNYIDNLIALLTQVDTRYIYQIIDALDKCHDKQATVYIMGNGGSAATASHMANDLSVGLKLREIRNFNVQSLSDNTPVCTAIANDIGYENVFYAQLKNKLQPDDLVIALSCSGNSENIVKASQYTKKIGATLVGMTGFDGGELKKISDISFHVNTDNGEYGLVEDVHMILDHIIYSYYIAQKPENKTNYTMR
tara:strand:- start:5661 stop:6254 length:594 start_codon:yes stop_codon:yes gene_type:complete